MEARAHGHMINFLFHMQYMYVVQTLYNYYHDNRWSWSHVYKYIPVCLTIIIHFKFLQIVIHSYCYILGIISLHVKLLSYNYPKDLEWACF